MEQTCAHCGASLAASESYHQGEKSLCEDCFLDAQTVTRTCDPWAVYTASRTHGRQSSLTPVQEEIIRQIKTQGPMPAPALCRQLGITPLELERNFTPLRHMQLLRAFLQDGQLMLALFRD